MDEQPMVQPAPPHTSRKIFFWLVGIIGSLFAIYLVWYVLLLTTSGPHPRTASRYTAAVNIGAKELVWMNDSNLNSDYVNQAAAASQHKSPMYLEVSSDGQATLIEQKVIPNGQETCTGCGWVVLSTVHTGKISDSDAQAFIQQVKAVKNERLGIIPTARATTFSDPIIDVYYATGARVQEMFSFYPPSSDYILTFDHVLNDVFVLPALTLPQFAVTTFKVNKFEKYDTNQTDIIFLTQADAQKFPALWESIAMPGRVAPVIDSSEQQYIKTLLSQKRIEDGGTTFDFTMLLDVTGLGKFRVHLNKLAP